MNKYILDSFRFPLDSEEAKSYFSSSILELYKYERFKYLSVEERYWNFLKKIFKVDKNFILRLRCHNEIDSFLFFSEKKRLKKWLKIIKRFDFSSANFCTNDIAYLEIFLKISYRDVFGYQMKYSLYFPTLKIYVSNLTDYHYLVIAPNSQKALLESFARGSKLYIFNMSV